MVEVAKINPLKEKAFKEVFWRRSKFKPTQTKAKKSLGEFLNQVKTKTNKSNDKWIAFEDFAWQSIRIKRRSIFWDFTRLKRYFEYS